MVYFLELFPSFCLSKCPLLLTLQLFILNYLLVVIDKSVCRIYSNTMITLFSLLPNKMSLDFFCEMVIGADVKKIKSFVQTLCLVRKIIKCIQNYLNTLYILLVVECFFYFIIYTYSIFETAFHVICIFLSIIFLSDICIFFIFMSLKFTFSIISFRSLQKTTR